MRSLLAGRRRLAAAGTVGVALVTLIIVLVGGSGHEGRRYPAPGDVEEVTSPEALDVSFIRDFAIGSDDTMYLAVGKDDDPRAVISISAKGARSTVGRSGNSGGGISAARALALGRDDLIYVADEGGKRVITRARNGRIKRIGAYAPADGAADTSPGLIDVRRMAVDPTTGDVYLADEHKIDRLGADGTLVTVAGARRPFDAKLEPAPDTFSVESGPETGPAPSFRFSFLEGIAFVPDTGELYALDFGRLIKIDRQGTLAVLPRGDLSVGDALLYDARRKNLYAGARSLVTDNSGIARIDLKGDALILSGSDPASSVSDQLAVDSRGNAYWLFDGNDDITTIGDLLSETRIDLKKRSA